MDPKLSLCPKLITEQLQCRGNTARRFSQVSLSASLRLTQGVYSVCLRVRVHECMSLCICERMRMLCCVGNFWMAL